MPEGLPDIIDNSEGKKLGVVLNQLLKQGAAIVMISSELPEILAMSDRILVMREGSLVKEFINPQEVTEELVLGYATGGIQDER